MSTPTELTDRISALPDKQAVGVLARVLQRQGVEINPVVQGVEWAAQEAHLRQALAQPEVAELASPEPQAAEGDLARTALEHLVDTDPASAQLVERALQLPSRETEKFDPTMLAVGALVLFVFRADINLTHDPGKGWTFKFRSKGLSESTIGKLLGQLMSTYLGPPAP
jgi:hypothetical protein